MLDSKKLLPRRSSSTRLSTETMKNFVVIKTDLIKIDSLLKERLVLSKVRAGIEKQMMQNKKRKEREEELERKKQKAKDGDELQLNDDPKKKKGGLLGFLLGGLITGVGALIIAALPMMVKIGKIIGKIARPIIQISTKIVDMLGSVVSTTFRGIKNLKENFPLDAINKIPAVAQSIGAGIVGLVAGLGAAAIFNTTSGIVGAANLKKLVEKTRSGSKLIKGSKTGSLAPRLTTGMNPFDPLRSKKIPITGSKPKVTNVIDALASNAQNMDVVEFMGSKPSTGVSFTQGEFINQILKLSGGSMANDQERGLFLADIMDTRFEGKKVAGQGADELIREAFYSGGALQRLKNRSLSGDDLIKIIDGLNVTPDMKIALKSFTDGVAKMTPDDLMKAGVTGIPKEAVLSTTGKQLNLLELDEAALEAEMRQLPDADELFGDKLGKSIEARGKDANVLKRQKITSGIGDDAGALARQVLRNKKATKIVSRPILKNFMKTTRQILSPIPLLGDLAILLLDIFVFGEIPARAGFKTIGSILGSLIGGVIGSLVPGPGTIAGAIIGGIAGDVIGAFVYDMLDIASVAQEAIKIDDTKDLGKSDLIRAGASGAVDFVTIKDLGGVIHKGMTFKNAENKDEFLFEGDLFQAAKDEGFGRDFQIANSLQGKRGFEYLRQRLSYEKGRKSRTRFIPLGGGVQQVAMNKGETVTQVIAAPDPSSFFESFNKQILYKRGC